MSPKRKKQKADLQKNYRVYLEVSMIVVLALCIVAMKLELRAGQSEVDFSAVQEVVQIKDVVRTEAPKEPPPVTPPEVIVQVPDDQIITDPLDPSLFDWDWSDDIPPKLPDVVEGDSEKIFVAVQQMPELLNKEEFYGNVEYPRECRLANIEGMVYVRFVVTETGAVSNAQVISGIGGGCDEYALKYVIENATFKPGRQRGNAVSVKFTLPITFKLQ